MAPRTLIFSIDMGAKSVQQKSSALKSLHNNLFLSGVKPLDVFMNQSCFKRSFFSLPYVCSAENWLSMQCNTPSVYLAQWSDIHVEVAFEILHILHGIF